MLHTVSFGLMLCNAVSKDGCDMKKSVIAKLNSIFFKKKPARLVTSFILLFV